MPPLELELLELELLELELELDELELLELELLELELLELEEEVDPPPSQDASATLGPLISRLSMLPKPLL